MEAAEAQQEVWIPQEDEWYEATVAHRDLRKQLLILSLTNGAKVICLTGKVTAGAAGHILCATNVPVGTSCAVRIQPKSNGDYSALECRFDSGKIPAKTVEKVVIVRWCEGRTFGTGIRPCGCPVFTSTSGRNGSFAILQEGDEVECEIVPSNRKVGLCAAYVVNQGAA